MKILAFDQATKTGWCLLEDGKLIDCGIIDMSGSSIKKQKDIIKESLKRDLFFDEGVDLYSWADKACNIRNSIINKYNQEKPDVVVFETVQDNNNHDVHTKLAGLLNLLMTTCIDNKIKFLVFPIISWKKEVGIKFSKKNELGKTVKTVREEHKQNAIDIVYDRFGVNVESDVADAICIALATDIILNR